MKATGIVRRVDDLGRIVIPKEIRRTLRIREGDPLEIYTEKDGGVIFRKYSPMGDLQEFAAQMCDAIGSGTGHMAAVADRDAIIALSGVLTLALDSMKTTVQALKDAGLNVKVIIGGAPVSAEACKIVGADEWAHSPQKTVATCKAWAEAL